MGINITTPALEDEFHDRKDYIDQLDEVIKDGNNVLLISPRKFGKSSLLLNFSPEGHHVVYIDLYDVETFEEFISSWLYSVGNKRLLSKVKEKFAGIEKILEKIETSSISIKGAYVELQDPFKKNWKDWAEKLVSELHNINNVVIILDEFPAMLENFIGKGYNKEELKAFLRWFSKIRTGFPTIRYIICGSVSLDFVVRQLNASDTFKDFKKKELFEMREDDTRDLLIKRLKEKRIEIYEEPISRALERLDRIPWFILLLAYELNQMNQNKKITPIKNPDVVDTAYENIIRNYNELRYYADRLVKYSREHYEASIKILYELTDDTGLPKKELKALYYMKTGGEDDVAFSHFIADLENDFYIKYDPDTDCYRFYSKVLKDWWSDYFKRH